MFTRRRRKGGVAGTYLASDSIKGVYEGNSSKQAMSDMSLGDTGGDDIEIIERVLLRLGSG